VVRRDVRAGYFVTPLDCIAWRNGRRHTVTVVADGYVWREATYASLSSITRAITDTVWNGHAFLA
jgi:hypothetical protein